jgi:hypothetical protein
VTEEEAPGVAKVTGVFDFGQRPSCQGGWANDVGPAAARTLVEACCAPSSGNRWRGAFVPLGDRRRWPLVRLCSLLADNCNPFVWIYEAVREERARSTDGETADV